MSEALADCTGSSRGEIAHQDVGVKNGTSGRRTEIRQSGTGSRTKSTELYRRTITEPCEHPEILSVLGLPEGSTWGAVLVKAAYVRAAEGNVQAINEITNRVDGPVEKLVEEEPLDTTGAPLEVAARIVARLRARLAAGDAGQVPQPVGTQTVDAEMVNDFGSSSESLSPDEH